MKLDAQQRSVSDHLRILCSNIPVLLASVNEEVEDRFSSFSQRLAASLSDLAAARRRSNGGALSESIAPLCEVVAAFEKKLVICAPNIAGISRGNQ